MILIRAIEKVLCKCKVQIIFFFFPSLPFEDEINLPRLYYEKLHGLQDKEESEERMLIIFLRAPLKSSGINEKAAFGAVNVVICSCHLLHIRLFQDIKKLA